jgi:2-polyprenyl-3-methyl-5-hydroxy-6-metoxy-1,4-benzoquinol methylase
MIRHLLRNKGIICDVFTDSAVKTDTVLNGIKFIPVQDAIEKARAGQYYFIITTVNPDYREQIMKRLLFCAIKDFAVIVHEQSYGFCGGEDEVVFRSAFLDMFNDIYENIPITKNSLRSIGLWYFTSPIWWGSYFSLLTNYFPTQKQNVKIVDIGPGIGEFALTVKKLYKFDLTFVVFPDFPKAVFDFESPAFEHLLKDVDIRKGYFELQDNWGGEYDMIIFMEVMEHLICDRVDALSKLKRMLGDDGVIILSSPVASFNSIQLIDNWRESYPNDIEMEEYKQLGMLTSWGHVYEWSKEELLDCAGLAGLKCVEYKTGPGNNQCLILKKR